MDIMSENQQPPADNIETPVSPKMETIEPFYFPDIAVDSILSYRPKSTLFVRSPLERIAALSFQSKRIAPASVPLNEHARRLLLSVLAEIQALPILAAPSMRGMPLELADIRDRGIPYRPAQWDNAPLDYARRQAYSRAAQWLEGMGFLRRITERHRNRVTHVQLTASGLQLALWLAGRHADRLAIAEGLRLTNWGKELASRIHVKPHCSKKNPPSQVPQ